MWAKLHILAYSALITVLAVVAFPSEGSEVCNAPTCPKISYFNASRTYYGKFNDNFWMMGPVYPGRPLPEQKKHIFRFEPVSVGLHDCSNKYFRCLSGLDGVFAVPRRRIKPNSKYSVAGSDFKIEKCIQGNKNICQVALISSRHVEISDNNHVTNGAPPNGDNEGGGLAIYFIYNEDVGVTAFGEVNRDLPSVAAKLAAASEFVLSGDVGLLAPGKRGQQNGT